jgi:two-component sensor histidine kinase
MHLAAKFAAFSANSDDLSTLQKETCRIAAEGLGVCFAKLLVYQAGERVFLVQEGVGWRKGIVGTARLDADVGTAAGFAWHTGKSIISNDLVSEGRFRIPSILAEHGIIRCVNVVIPGDAEAAFGVLEVESPEPGKFTTSDVNFLELLVHSLAAAIARVDVRTVYEQQAGQTAITHEVSLHELQHRVRNDLQVIHSVVSREARGTTDLMAGVALDRIGRRIMALAALYDHLLGKGSTDHLDMGVYLDSLCSKIAIVTDLSSRAITLRAETEHLMMPLSRAVRLAVAANELIANAATHAFPDKRPGQITVSLFANGKDGTDCPSMSVADDGCGFQGPRPGSAGLSFVEQLVRQAGGVLDRTDHDGTQWHIRIPPT